MINAPDAFETLASQAATVKGQAASQALSVSSKHMLKTIISKAVLTAKSQVASNSVANGGKEIVKTVANPGQVAKSAALSNAIALPFAIIIDGGFLTYECLKMKKQLNEKKMSQEDFDKEVTKKTFGSVGGLSAGFGCAVAAAAIGTAVCPGIGTLAGAGIGLVAGVTGSFAGRFGGNLAGRGVYAAVIRPLKNKIQKRKQMKRNS